MNLQNALTLPRSCLGDAELEGDVVVEDPDIETCGRVCVFDFIRRKREIN